MLFFLIYPFIWLSSAEVYSDNFFLVIFKDLFLLWICTTGTLRHSGRQWLNVPSMISVQYYSLSPYPTLDFKTVTLLIPDFEEVQSNLKKNWNTIQSIAVRINTNVIKIMYVIIFPDKYFNNLFYLVAWTLFYHENVNRRVTE